MRALCVLCVFVVQSEHVRAKEQHSMSTQTTSTTITPLVPGPEVRAFEQAQQLVLDTFGIAAQSRYVQLQTPPLRVHVLEMGRGKPVVFIHGGNAVAVQLAPLLAALHGSFHLFAPDRPGCGLTEPFDYRDVPFRHHAVQFVAGVLDALGLPRAALVANSMGGYWALVFALAHPERVTKLVLVGEPAGSAPLQGPLPPRPAQAQPTLDDIRASYAARLVAHPERIPAALLEASHAAALLPGAARAWDTMLERIRQERLGLTYALRPELGRLRPDTLFIWGDKDTFGSPTLGVEMAALAPNARCEIIEDAGHLPFLDQPERCAQLTSAFLAG